MGLSSIISGIKNFVVENSCDRSRDAKFDFGVGKFVDKTGRNNKSFNINNEIQSIVQKIKWKISDKFPSADFKLSKAMNFLNKPLIYSRLARISEVDCFVARSRLKIAAVALAILGFGVSFVAPVVGVSLALIGMGCLGILEISKSTYVKEYNDRN